MGSCLALSGQCLALWGMPGFVSFHVRLVMCSTGLHPVLHLVPYPLSYQCGTSSTIAFQWRMPSRVMMNAMQMPPARCADADPLYSMYCQGWGQEGEGAAGHGGRTLHIQH